MRQQEQRQQNIFTCLLNVGKRQQQQQQNEKTNIDFDHHHHQLQLVQQRVMNGNRKVSDFEKSTTES